MSNRSNLYKNPSFAYKKAYSLSSVVQNLQTYNAITGNAPPPVDPREHLEGRAKRRREPKQKKGRQIEVDDGPMSMSHQDYIRLRRHEACSSQGYEKLGLDVVGSSTRGLHLVDYGSDSDDDAPPMSNQQVPCHGDTPIFARVVDFNADSLVDSILDHVEQVDRTKTRSEQRFPLLGEPVCIICGRYGEYICNETDDDICSMDCKAVLLKQKHDKPPEGVLNNQAKLSSYKPRGSLVQADLEEDTWDFDRNRWSKKRSCLSTYECWKCNRPGHLAEDCLVSKPCLQPLNMTQSSNQGAFEPKRSVFISAKLRELYRRCHQISKSMANAKCNACCNSFSLATCLDCNTVTCDSAGHLSRHISAHSAHHHIYSHKLERLVKCCKSTCEVADIRDLLACHYCFDKAFNKFYDMYTATWKREGFAMIWGSICCEDHFEWHRMNCLNADVEDRAYIFRRGAGRGKNDQLSELIF